MCQALACADQLTALIEEVRAIGRRGPHGELLCLQVGRERRRVLPEPALERAGLAHQLEGPLRDRLDGAHVARVQGLDHLAVEAVQGAQEKAVHAVVAACGLDVLVTLADQALELAGDLAHVVEGERHADQVVAHDGREQDLQRRSIERQAELAQLPRETLALLGQGVLGRLDPALQGPPLRLVARSGAPPEGALRGADPLLTTLSQARPVPAGGALQLPHALPVAESPSARQEGRGLVEHGVRRTGAGGARSRACRRGEGPAPPPPVVLPEGPLQAGQQRVPEAREVQALPVGQAELPAQSCPGARQRHAGEAGRPGPLGPCARQRPDPAVAEGQVRAQGGGDQLAQGSGLQWSGVQSRARTAPDSRSAPGAG